MRLQISNRGPLKVDELADEARLSAEDLDSQRMRQGFGLAWGLIGLIGLVLVLVGIYAIATYPGPDEVGACPTCTNRLETLQDLRTEWFSQVKDLLQTPRRLFASTPTRHPARLYLRPADRLPQRVIAH